jgi:hypothetical protein
MLVFGWAYILSVKLVKLREKSLEGKVQYTDDMAKTANGYSFKSGTTNIASLGPLYLDVPVAASPGPLLSMPVFIS